jgi:hypothetical protein
LAKRERYLLLEWLNEQEIAAVMGALGLDAPMILKLEFGCMNAFHSQICIQLRTVYSSEVFHAGCGRLFGKKKSRCDSVADWYAMESTNGSG